MGGGANQLDPAFVGLMVGFGAFEAGQEGMMDVDRAPGQPAGGILSPRERGLDRPVFQPR
jgi:hypothetical protein